MNDEILKLCEKCGIQGLVIDGESISDYCAEPRQLEAFYKSAFNAGIEAAASEQLAAVTQQLAECERERDYWKGVAESECDAKNELHQVCRDAYEVWAGSEGIPEPVYASEAYLYQLLINMRDEVKRGVAKVGAGKTGEM